MQIKKTTILFLGILSLFFVAFPVHAAGVGDSLLFSVNSDLDASARTQVQAELIKVSPDLYFYAEKAWWDQQVPAKQQEILSSLDQLSNEFSDKIYPTLTSVFGTEWRPGVDGDDRMTVLFENMQEGDVGYFRQNDEYLKIQVPDSNEREMMYLSLDDIDDFNAAKVVLAHELMHLIIFNQKNKMQGVQEDQWLDEARSDYTSTMLGYDDTYEGSNLQQRVQDFAQDPSDSLTEFLNSKYDFATVHLFMDYLVDHYSIQVLVDSLHEKSVGIQSINDALAKEGAKENFSQIFTDWTIANLINDCSVGPEYCYLNQNLATLKINPTLNFLPVTGNSSLSVTNVTKNWSGNWQKIIGGSGNLTLDFESLAGLNFQVPYVLVDAAGNESVNFLQLDQDEKGEIEVNNFGTDYTSLIILPSLQSKTFGFDGLDPTYPYTFTASVSGSVPDEDQNEIQKLLSQIDELQKEIAALQGQGQTQGSLCSSLNANLYAGLQNSDVSCLQQFLKSQGTNIYPQGLVTGYFGTLTKAAVIRFQEAYDISQTGFVGVITRTKINSLLHG